MTGTLLTQIEAYAQNLVSEKRVHGCVVAAVDVANGVKGCSSVGLGDADPKNKALWADDTIFGLDSITKVFTAIMFARALLCGCLDETSYIDKYLPAGTQLKPRIRNKITLRMLANYTSQFPNKPSNFPKVNGKRDPAAYTIQLFQQYLEDDFNPKPQYIGSNYLYSSLAFGLLGYIMVNAYGAKDYQELLCELLTDPLKMYDTVVQPSGAQLQRVAIGYCNGKPQPPLEPAPFLGGGGVLRSTGKDMLIFLNALVTRTGPGSLPDAFARTEELTFDKDGHRIGLGWFIKEQDAAPSFAKDGGGSGFSSLIEYLPSQRRGLFAAGNAVKDLNFHREFGRLLGTRSID